MRAAPLGLYYHEDIPIADWAADRERTVFVVGTSGLRRFLAGFRAFRLSDGGSAPPEFVRPPAP